MELNLIVIIGLIGTLCSIIFGFLGYQRGQKLDYKSSGKVEGSLEADILYIKRRTDDVLLEQKDTNRNISLLTERVARVEESSKSAHNRIDTLESDFKSKK